MFLGKSGHCIVPTEANILLGQRAEKRDCLDGIGTVGNSVRNTRGNKNIEGLELYEYILEETQRQIIIIIIITNMINVT